MDFEVGKNTYITVSEADSIVAESYFEDSEEYNLWQQLSEKNKQILILNGTAEIERLPFLGRQVEIYQELKWPRYIQGRECSVPRDVQIAIIKTSIENKIDAEKQETKLQDLGVKSYSIKGASITFSNDAENKKAFGSISQEIYREHLSRWTY